MASFFLTQVLDKMGSVDKDIRFMATHDLANEMEKDSFKMDPLMEQKIVMKLLTLINDTANNVQENVVKCLGLMIKFVKDANAIDITDALLKGLLESDKEELHEISSIGLRTIIGNMPTESNVSIVVTKKIAPKMLEGIEKSKPGDKTEVKMYCLDILNYLLTKYGPIVPNLEQVRDVVLPNLNASRPATRKRAINCLASFAIPASDELFYGLMDNVIKQIDEAKKADHISTLIQLIGQVGKSSGYRLGKYLGKIMPYIIKNCDNSKFDQNDELKENCLLCFESIVEKCQKDVTPYLQDIINLSIKYIKFDPNYEDDEDQDDEMDTEDQEDEEEQEEDDEEDISDDDDISWKIRRSAAKTITAIITHRPELLLSLYEKVSPILIARFKEREEGVKLEIFSTFVLLLKYSTKKNVNPKCFELLRQQVSKLISAIKKPLVDKSIKIRVGAFQLLKELIILVPGILSSSIDAIVPGVTLSLSEKNTNSNLKIEALVFLRVLLSNHPNNVFYPHAKVLSTHIVKCVRESYYRISSEALRVCQEFVTVLRPVGKSTTQEFDYKPYANELYEAAQTQLKAQDIDQEVKESAISCIGTILATFGDSINVQPCLSILLDRLDNEITRVTTLKALSKILESPIKVDISTMLPKAIESLATFLRKNNRTLKQNTLIVLNDIALRKETSALLQPQISTILTELSANINENDLQLTNLSFIFYKNLLANVPSSSKLLKEKLLPATLTLLKSSLLQGVALESLLTLLSEIVTKNEPGVTFTDLLNALLDAAKQIKQPVTRQSFASISQCIAAITCVASQQERSSTIEKLLTNLSSSAAPESTLLSLTCIGEIGRRLDLSSFKSVHTDIFKTFDSTNEEIKQVAALSLGNIAISSLSTYVPFILENIKSQPKKQYLLLHSLREAIVKLSHTAEKGIQAILPFLPSILPLLFENATNEEEGTRNLVAECLGKLSVVDPATIIPQLEQKITSAPLERATVVTSIKFAILESSSTSESDQAQLVSRFLVLLKDSDLIVKRSALLTLNYISHNRPGLIRGQLDTYLPVLYDNCRIKPELIREVDLGPFKHKVDDGIEIRKTAFECMYTLLDTSAEKIEIPPFVESIAAGLKDTQHDIKLLCHLLVVRLASVNGQALLEGLTLLVEPFKATLLAKVLDQTVKQQVERNEECIRSCLRAIASIHRIPSSESIVKFEEFIRTTIRTNPKLNTTFTTILEEDNSIKDEMDTSE